MIVLDAYAVIALLRGEAAADAVAELLRTNECVLTATGVAEVVDHLVRIVGADPDDVLLDLASLGLLDAAPLEPLTAARAGVLRAERYHRTRCAVSMADCIVVASARALDAVVCTSDPHLLDVCHADGIAVHVLPGSDGGRWTSDR